MNFHELLSGDEDQEVRSELAYAREQVETYSPDLVVKFGNDHNSGFSLRLDDFNRPFFSLQIEGSKTGLELPGIVDEIVTLADIRPAEGAPYRAFVCMTLNEFGFPAKDRSGRLTTLEPAHLGRLMDKIRGPLFIARFDRGDVQVLTNCMVLTEGFDSQPVGCIGILRPMLHKGTFIQAVGRGLRKVDPQRYPGIIKTDCVILDFAGAAIRHGCLEQEISLDDEDTDPSAAPYKTCPDCEAEIPLGTGECPFCGHVFTRQVGEKHVLTDFELLEIDLLNQSPFQWCDVSRDGLSLIASGFDAWAGVFYDGTLWHALGGPKNGAPRKIAIGTKVQALAEADDFLRSAESSLAAAKSKRWLKEPASTKQLNCLRRAGASVSPMNLGFSKYDANCQLRYYWNRHAITSAVFGQAHRSAA